MNLADIAAHVRLRLTGAVLGALLLARRARERREQPRRHVGPGLPAGAGRADESTTESKPAAAKRSART